MRKAPAFQFYVSDYLKDTRSLTLRAKGAWSDLLCFMWAASERGKLEKTIEGFSRMIGAGMEETKLAIIELWEEGVCDIFIDGKNVTCNDDVTNCNKKVTIINRRMNREERERINTRVRVRRYRAKSGDNDASNSDVTPPSSSSSSLKKKTSKKESVGGAKILTQKQQEKFDQWYEKYPNKKARGAAERAWKSLNPDDELLKILIEAITLQVNVGHFVNAKGENFTPHPATWLNQRRWEDEIKCGDQATRPDFKRCTYCNSLIGYSERACRNCGRQQ